MPIEIQLPDGSVAQFPDGMSDADINAILQKEFAQGSFMPDAPDPSKVNEINGVLVPAPAPPTPEKGFMERVGNRFDERLLNIRDINKATAAGNQSIGEWMLQRGGQGAAFGSDVLVEGLKSAANGVSSVVPESIKQPVKSAAQYGLDSALATDTGRTLATAAGDAVQGYQNFAQENPRSARNLEAVLNLGTSGLPVTRIGGKSAVGAVESLAKKGAVGAFDVAGGAATKLNTRTIIPGADQVREQASNLYKQADELQATFSPKFTDQVINMAEKVSPQTQQGKIFAGENDITRAVTALSELRGQPLSLQAANEIDKELTGRISTLYRAGNNEQASALSELQTNFRNMLENAPDNLVTGGKEGIATVKEARKLWGVSKRMDDIERIIERADMTDNPATAIKTGFRTLAMNKNKMAGYTQAEKEAIKKAAKSGVGTDILRLAGSRIIPIITGATGGGISGTASATAASIASRGMASKAQLNRAEQVSKMLAERSGLTKTEPRLKIGSSTKELAAPPETPSIPQMLALPAPNSEIIADASGVSRFASPLERDSAIMARQRAADMGLTPDVVGAQNRMNVSQMLLDRGQSDLGRMLAETPYLTLKDVEGLSQEEAMRLLKQKK